jgi:hypothetical protein
VNNLGKGVMEGENVEICRIWRMKMNDDSRRGSGSRDRLAIIEIIREEMTVNQIYILIVIRAGIVIISDSNNVGNDG